MPVAAKLSREVYEKLGDETVNALVDFLNSVDASSQAQIRELNEANSRRIDARFDAVEAKLDAKLETLRVELHAFKAELIKWMLLFWIGTAATVAGLIRFLQPQ
jgi:hypothetical protein